jgi:hypothetical protein
MSRATSVVMAALAMAAMDPRTPTPSAFSAHVKPRRRVAVLPGDVEKRTALQREIAEHNAAVEARARAKKARRAEREIAKHKAYDKKGT